MASPARPCAKRIAAAPAPIGLLTDDLLAEILLRLPTLADIGRAAATCASFRRVTDGRAFLRRLRSVHPAPLLGILLKSWIQPAELPHSSASFARAFAGEADLSFSFLPPPGRWFPVDARDGRVLLERCEMSSVVFAVCDPLFQRYALLPQIPIDRFLQLRHGIKPFLVPASDEEDETSFRVVCAERDAAEQLVAFIFSSATQQWSRLAVGAGVQSAYRLPLLCGYAYGCFYWKDSLDGTDNLIVFDTRSMEFSSVHIAFSQDQQDLVIVEAGGGRLGMFTLDNSIISAASHLVYATQEINEGGSSRWWIERRVRLPSQYRFNFLDVTDRCLLLHGTPWNLYLGSNMDDVHTGYFSFEFESMQIEKIYAFRFRNGIPHARLYAGFPPSLCLPTI